MPIAGRLMHRVGLRPLLVVGLPLVAATTWLFSSLDVTTSDTTIKLWDPQTGKLRQTLTGPKNRLESLAFSPDGKTLASGSGGPEALIWLWPIAEAPK